MPSAIEIRQEAGQLVEQSRALIEREENGGAALTADEEKQADKMFDDAEAKLAQADRLERKDRLAAGFEPDPEAAEKEERTETGSADLEDGSEEREAAARVERAFGSYLRGGLEGMEVEERATLQMDNDIGGGFFAMPEQFINKILQTADARLVLRQLGTVYQCNRNETLGAPSLDGDITEFTFGGGEIQTAVEDTGVAFGKRELRPRDMIAKVVKISRPLLENPRIDVEQVVSDRVAYQLAAGQETGCMTGSGAGEPLGLFVASDDGIGTARDVATGNATGVTANGLIDVQGTLDDVYDPQAQWLFHKDFVTLIRKLVTGDGQYLWQPGLQGGIPSKILDRPYITAGKVPSTYTNGLYAGMYGDFSFYWMADAVNLTVQRLVELYSLTNQVGLLFNNVAFDGMPVMAEAFVRIKCAA